MSDRCNTGIALLARQTLPFEWGDINRVFFRVSLGPATLKARENSARRLQGVTDDNKKHSRWKRWLPNTCVAEEEPPIITDISSPTDFQHHFHATFDPATVRYTGLPEAWQNQVLKFNQQFGVPLVSIPRADVAGYDARIPVVLEVLKCELKRFHGLEKEGVFRLSANKSTQDKYKTELNQGFFVGCKDESDVNSMACLIKEWFRDLPEPLMSNIPRDVIVNASKHAAGAYAQIMGLLPDPHRSIFLWLLDLLAETSTYESTNRMSPKALAIVLAPNLYTVPSNSSPMEMMALMDAAVSTVHICLLERMNVLSSTGILERAVSHS